MSCFNEYKRASYYKDSADIENSPSEELLGVFIDAPLTLFHFF